MLETHNSKKDYCYTWLQYIWKTKSKIPSIQAIQAIDKMSQSRSLLQHFDNIILFLIKKDWDWSLMFIKNVRWKVLYWERLRLVTYNDSEYEMKAAPQNSYNRIQLFWFRFRNLCWWRRILEPRAHAKERCATIQFWLWMGKQEKL